MYHIIKFAVDFLAEVEVSRKHRLERVPVRKGTRLPAQIKPAVIEGGDGPVEVADLFFEDGTTARGVPFAYFSFPDE